MSKLPHKFQEKMQTGMTYEQYFRSSCQEKILLAEELERFWALFSKNRIRQELEAGSILEFTQSGVGIIIQAIGRNGA